MNRFYTLENDTYPACWGTQAVSVVSRLSDLTWRIGPGKSVGEQDCNQRQHLRLLALKRC